MKEVFKIYGPAIGPALAFLLGILALFVKYRVDSYLDKARTLEKLNQLKQLIRTSPPPSYYFPLRADTDKGQVMHADELRNLTNLSRFYNRLIATKLLVENITEDIFHHGEENEIRQFNNIKWWHDILFTEVEKLRENREALDEMAFYQLGNSYERMLEACDNPDQLLPYIEPQ